MRTGWAAASATSCALEPLLREAYRKVQEEGGLQDPGDDVRPEDGLVGEIPSTFGRLVCLCT